MLTSSTAYAQPARDKPTGWGFSAGAGLFHKPNYTGDNSSELILAPSIRATYGEHWTISFRQGVQYTVNPQSAWSWGLAVTPFMGRDSDGSSPLRISGDGTDDLLGFDDTDTTVAMKVFTEYKNAGWALTMQAQQSASSDPESLLSLGLRRSGRIKTQGPPLIVSAGLSLEFGDQQTLQSLVGVTPAQSAAIGLAAYQPDAGLVSYAIYGRVILPLTRSLSAMSVINVKHLGTELENSSLVSERGDPLQVSTGVFLTYRFKSK